MEVSSQMGPFSIVPEWVLDRGLSPTALKLYIVMARFADWQTGMAFPSRETLAQRMGCSLKTVDRAVIEVVAAECVKKISRGRYASALYQVYQVDPRGTDLSSEWTDMTSEGTDLSSRPDKNDDITITTKRKPTKREPFNKGFDTFWAVYPKKDDKPLAKRSFEKALDRSNLELIIAGAERYRDDPNREDLFTKNPSTWLNADAWENGPLPSRVVRKPRKLTNAEEGFLLVEKLRERDRMNTQQPKELDYDMGLRLKGVDNE
jgi:hypothetical protein